MSCAENLEQSLAAWKTSGLINDSSTEHLDDETLYQLACDNAASDCEPQHKQHLSCCPICMEKWANWRKAISATQSSQQQPQHSTVSYGMLEAAADNNSQQPLSLHSHCGCFNLGLFPDREHPDSALVTLKSIGANNDQLEGQQVTVRDKNGTIILDCPLRDGRAARRIEQLSNLDLTQWTVVISTDEDDA